MAPVFECSLLPGRTEKSKALREERTVAPRGNSYSEGPEKRFSLKWLFGTYGGIIWLQFYFWLIKDWSWSQLHWIYTGMIFGSLAVVWGFFLVVGALFLGAYSEASLALGMELWVIANYWWMIGEFWGYQFTTVSIPDWLRPQEFTPLEYEYEYENGTYLFNESKIHILDGETRAWHEYEVQDAFYDRTKEDTQIISTLATCWLFFTIFIMPLFFNDRDNALLKLVNDNSPPPRFSFWFRDFGEYEGLHLFFWSLKDSFWAWDNQIGYCIGFALTLLFIIDGIILLWTHSGFWIELFHYFALLLWVIANGVWAIGELFSENPREYEILWEGWNLYTWIPPFKEYTKYFWGRNSAGYFFFFAVLTIVFHYCYWICCATINFRESSEKEDEMEKGSSESTSAETNPSAGAKVDHEEAPAGQQPETPMAEPMQGPVTEF